MEFTETGDQLPETDGALLVALTGFGQEEDRRRTKEAGFDDHLVKPVDPMPCKTRSLASNGASSGGCSRSAGALPQGGAPV